MENNENSKREPKLITIIGANRRGFSTFLKQFTCKCGFIFKSVNILNFHKTSPSKKEIDDYGKCPKCHHKNKILFFDTNGDYNKEINTLSKVSEHDIKNWVANLKYEYDQIQKAKSFFSSILPKHIVLDDTETFMYHSPLSKPEPIKWWELSKHIKIFKP